MDDELTPEESIFCSKLRAVRLELACARRKTSALG